MNKLKCFFLSFIALCSVAYGASFTISSYNCGGLSDHYDYLRAACMQQLIQKRYNAEPQAMAQLEKVQEVALKILFSQDPTENEQARLEWEEKNMQQFFEHITASPLEANSPNSTWYQLSSEMITPYNERPVMLRDKEINKMLQEHLEDLSLTMRRAMMAEHIFHHDMKYDIICLQEADYLNESMFPDNFKVLFSTDKHSINGVAWNKNRFDLIESIGNIQGRAFAVLLRDKETDETLLVASAHLSGCNPFTVEKDPKTGKSDSGKGDHELETILQLFVGKEADVKIVAMDSNVTATHPRLELLKEYGYSLDYSNYLMPTCTNPYQVLNTRIDWIAIKAESAAITNIPVFNVSLDSIQTNMSDHKPIAAIVQSACAQPL